MTWPVRLAAANEDPGTDYTGEIISFSDVGPGGGAPTHPPPRPWLCVTNNPIGVRWLFPNGTEVPTRNEFATEEVPEGSEVATGDQLFTTLFSGALALYRGPTHNSPDGEHCCVVTGTTQRRCVTFSEC